MDHASASLHMAVRIYRELGKSHSENIVFSPASIGNALALLETGARGSTQAQIHKAMGWPEDLVAQFRTEAAAYQSILNGGLQGVTTAHANGLWTQTGMGLTTEFRAGVARFGGRVEEVDFETHAEETRDAVNRWIADITRQLIPDLLAPGSVNGATRLLLANAIYLKGDWLRPFNLDMTREGPFSLIDGRKVNVPFMSMQEPTFPYYHDKRRGVQVVSMPIGNGRERGSTRMMIILPDDGTALSKVEAAPDGLAIFSWFSKLGETSFGGFRIPKFNLGMKASLTEVMRSLGIEDAFDPERADFSGIASAGSTLAVSDVIHGAKVDVNETGVEAGAGTAMDMYLGGSSGPEFIADRPFLWAILDVVNKIPLFMGRVMHPVCDDPTRVHPQGEDSHFLDREVT